MKIYFDKNNGPIDEIITALDGDRRGYCKAKYVRELIIASLKAGQEDDKSADLKLMNTTLKRCDSPPRSSAPTRTYARSRSRLGAYQAGRPVI